MQILFRRKPPPAQPLFDFTLSACNNSSTGDVPESFESKACFVAPLQNCCSFSTEPQRRIEYGSKTEGDKERKSLCQKSNP
jgi:hypothetical protein